MTPRRVKVTGDLFHGRVPEGAIYVGRAAPGLKASPYRNPFPVRRYGLAESRRLYLAHLRERPDLLAGVREQLRGRDLACWCPLDAGWCHADDLLALANGDDCAVPDCPPSVTLETPMITLLSQARRAGVRIDTSSGRPAITGPDHLVRELETHLKRIAYWLREGHVLLDWSKRSTIYHATGCVLCCDIRDDRGRHPKDCANCLYYRGRRPDPCVLCRRTAHLVEDGRPVHKACVERYVWQLLQALLDTTDQQAKWLVVAALCDCNRVAVTVMDQWTPGTETAGGDEVAAVGADWKQLAQRLALDLRQATGRPISAPCSTVIARDTDRRLQLAGELTELLYAIDS